MSIRRGLLVGILASSCIEAAAQGWELVRGRLEGATPLAFAQSSRTGRLWVSTGELLYTAPTLGTAWTAVTSLPFPLQAIALAIDGTSEALLVVTPYGLWRSTDDGATWAQTHPIVADRGTRLYVHPTYPNVVVAVRGQMLWRSTDAGATWEPMTLPPGTLYEGCPFGALADVWAWSSAGLFRSSDGGTSWEAVSTTLPAQPVQSLALTSGIEPSICLLLPSGVYRSTDGVNWTETTLPPGVLPRALFAAGNTVVAVAPGSLLVLRADNSWQPVYTGYTDHITALLPVAPDRILVGSALRGVELYRWTPQPQWQALRTGMDAPPIVWLARRGSASILAGPSGVFWTDSDLAGLDNITLTLPKPAPITGFAAYPAGVVIATPGGIHRYVRSTGQWHTLSETLPTVGAITALAVTPGGDTIVALSEFGELVRSTDGGTSWETPPLTLQLSQLLAADGTVYGFGDDGLFRSTDAGATWQPVSGYPQQACHLLSIHPTSPQHLLAASTLPGSRTGKLYRSTDGGQSWQELPASSILSRGLTSIGAGSTASTWYLGTLEGEVFYTADGGLSWSSLGIVKSGLPIYAIGELGQSVLVGTRQGVWQRTVASVSLSTEPVPFTAWSDGEQLFVHCTSSAPGTLELFTLTGQRCALWDIAPAGDRLVLRLPPHAAGAYILRLQQGHRRHYVVLILP